MVHINYIWIQRMNWKITFLKIKVKCATWKVALPSLAGTTKHVYKKHKTKQGTTPGRGEQLPCEVDYHPVPQQWQTWKHTTLKYKKVELKCINIKYMTPCIWTKNFHTYEPSSFITSIIINILFIDYSGTQCSYIIYLCTALRLS